MPYKIGLSEKRKSLLENELARIIPKIIESGVEKIILFGSLCSGFINKSSDIDIIIVKKTGKRFIDRLDEFYQVLTPQTGLDFFVYTPEEFEQMKQNNQFIRAALKNSRIIYEK